MYLKAHDPAAYAVTMDGRRYPVRGGVFLVSADIDPLLVETFERDENVPAEVSAELSQLGNWPADDVVDEVIPPAPEPEDEHEDDLDEISDDELATRVLEVYPEYDFEHVVPAIVQDRAAVVADLRRKAAEIAAAAEQGDGAEKEPTIEERIDAADGHAEVNALAEELGVEGFKEKKPGVEAKKAALREKAAEIAAAAEQQ